MRLLVTGGAGFVGSHFVRTLLGPGSPLGNGIVVTVLDKLTYAGNLHNLAPVRDDLEFVEGDVADPDLVGGLVGRQDAIVHFAAESHVDRSIVQARSFVHANVLGTQTLLDAALLHGVGPFIHISTDEVYGPISEGSFTEEGPLRASSPYSASKAASDLLALSYHRTYGLDVRVTRCTNNYGPYQHPEKIIPRFITNLLLGRRLPLYGDGRNVRDWLHVDDHCRGIRLVLQHGGPGEIYNIAGGVELTNRQLTAHVLEACGESWDLVEHVDDRKGHDLRYSIDWTKIRNLGYRPRTDFAGGLAETVRWYCRNPRWWSPLTPPLQRSTSPRGSEGSG